jgi:peptidyl-tRNA hydrolase, PTH1 family
MSGIDRVENFIYIRLGEVVTGSHVLIIEEKAGNLSGFFCGTERKDLYLLAGLGNPGDKYEETRHNIGFMALDYLAGQHGLFFTESKWGALVSKAVLWDAPVLLVKPQTFMNAGGKAIGAIASFFKIPSDLIVVVHDELDLPLGRVKIVVSRGPGGHNGIRSIISEMGTSNFCRIRAGIGRPEPPLPVVNYVLSRFEPAETVVVQRELELVGEAVRQIIKNGASAAMTSINAAQEA